MRTHRPNARRAFFAATALLLACGGSGASPPGGAGGPSGGPPLGGGGPVGGNGIVAGQVLDGFGQPLANRTVLVAGRSTTTDANGAFGMTGVTSPYDVVIVEAANKVATVYAQLTRADPKLRDFGDDSNAAHSANLGGNIVGGDALPTQPGTLTGISWGSPESSTGNDVTATPYSFPVAWSGPTITTGSVHGLQWTVDGNGTVTGYRSHGVKTGVSLADGTTVTNADLQLAAVLASNVSGTVGVPAGYTISDRSVFLTFDDGAVFQVSSDTLPGTGFSFTVPSGIGASVVVNFTANDGKSQTNAQLSGVAPGTSSAALTLPSPALPTAPASGATGVDTGSDLVWSPLQGGVHVLVLTGSSSDPAYLIVSGGTRTRIPDLTAQGLGLPSGRRYTWALIGVGPYASIDAFAASAVFPREGFGFHTGASIGFTTR